MYTTFENPIELTDAELDAVSGGKKVDKHVKNNTQNNNNQSADGGTVTFTLKGKNTITVTDGSFNVSADGGSNNISA